MPKENRNIINVHVTPKSGRDIICGLEPDQKGLPYVKVKVTAAPEAGKANAAVIKLLSKSMGIAKSRFSVLRGDKSRYKQINVDCKEEIYLNWLKTI